MADLSDITAYLAQTVAGVIYPNGTSSPSIAPIPTGFTNPADVRIYEGWPVAAQLDLDIAGKELSGSSVVARTNGPLINVSIFPMLGLNVIPYQIQNRTQVITQPTYGLTVTTSGTGVTVTGTPATGEFVTIVADRTHIYSRGGTTAVAILTALLADVQVDYPSASVTGNTITVPYAFQMDVRQGGVGLLGHVTHRQRQNIMVTVWAATPAARTSVSAAIDVALKSDIVVNMPDTSQAKITYVRTNVLDEGENVRVYRRDLIYEAEYATLETYPGTVITSVTTQIDGGQPPYAQANAIT